MPSLTSGYNCRPVSYLKQDLHAVWLFLIFLGIILRLIISWHSIGSNDAEIWMRFSRQISDHRLLWMYRHVANFNHPPLMGEWSLLVKETAVALGLFYPFIFRLLPIASDLGVCILLYVIVERKAGRKAGYWVALAFSWCPAAILVSGYHCNVDSVYVFFVLLAIYFIEEKKRFLYAGLALSAAINVKLIPVLLILPLISLLKRGREERLFIIGLSLGAIPFAIVLSIDQQNFLSNVLFYNPQFDLWGTGLLYDYLVKDYTRSNYSFLLYRGSGRIAIILAILGLSFVSRLYRLWNGYQIAALTMALFLILTSGFGVQYTIAPLALLFAVDIPIALAYGTAAGIYLLTIYTHFWTGTFPAYSRIHTLLPAKEIGLITWGVLCYFVFRYARKPEDYSLPSTPINSRHSPLDMPLDS